MRYWKETPGKKLSDFDFTPLTVILHILSITILIRCGNILFTACQVIFGIEKTKKTWIIFKIITWPSPNLVERVIFRFWIQINKQFKCMTSFWRHNDETSITYVWETEKVYCLIMTSFFNQSTWNFALGLFIRLQFPTKDLVQFR